MGRFIRTVAAALAIFTTHAEAQADDLIVKLNVTIREEPSRHSERVAFPAVGSRLDLLDEDARVSGYYRVRLADGREGWVYQTFVRRVPDEGSFSLRADEMAAHYIDVDQGAAALLEFPCAAVLIDAGGRGQHNDPAAERPLIDYLDAFFARRQDLDRKLAAVFVTHTHVDHNAGLETVAQRYRVGGYIHNGRLNGSGRHNARWMARFAADQRPQIPTLALQDVPRGGLTSDIVDPVSCDGVDPRIRVLSGGFGSNPGWSDEDFGNGNNHSLVIRVDFGEASHLFSGDLEQAGIRNLLAQSAPGIDADVWLVSHHGAENGTNEALLQAISPEIAVISMGPSAEQLPWTAWQHGHPRKVTVALLDRFVSRRRARAADVSVATGQRRYEPYPMRDAIYATGWDGHVVIKAALNGTLSVDTSR